MAFGFSCLDVLRIMSDRLKVKLCSFCYKTLSSLDVSQIREHNEALMLR